jgi:hypothetical protein
VKTYYSSLFTVLLFMLLLLGHGVLVGNPLLHAQSGNSTGLPDKVGVKITFPHANSTIPVGTLAVNGTSSDTSQTDCRVYIDWNDLKPMQNVTASGINGTNDYSNWTFTYDQNYHVIAEGINELTSKIVCINNPSGNMTTKFYSINVTGIMNNSSSTSPSVPAALNQTDSNSNGYHTVSYQGILPQYNGATIEEADESIVKDKDSDDKGDPETNADPELNADHEVSDDAEVEDTAEVVDTPVDNAEVDNAEVEDTAEVVDTPVDNAEVDNAEVEDTAEVVDTPVDNAELGEIEVIDDAGLSDGGGVHISNPNSDENLDEDIEVNDESADSENDYYPETLSGFYTDVEDTIQHDTNEEFTSDAEPVKLKDSDDKDHKDKKEDDNNKKDKNSNIKGKKIQKKPILKTPSKNIGEIDPFKAT